ncbi:MULTISPECIES: cyclophilin-like fold protein [Microbacterium]|uniref:Cyclophilin-like domain-containing protein n=1 Tax=Microbacterium trichothecenolyticum TaxID=69370 RepID=A0A0M2HEE0_MICTR|nr:MULTISPECIES: cyclophilin-like fold protein [Microbacterium]KJL42573.1 hypothetical protein RS82_02130 [Microbacterium trichothecenolyticum]MDR7190326.1 hypothetical protein [Microbacterium sp. BE35]
MTSRHTAIDIELPGMHLTGSVDHTPIASSLLALLPLTLQFTDFGAQEKIGRLPAALRISGAPRSSNAPAATIAYYQPAQSLVLYYEDVGTFPGIMPVGWLDEVTGLREITSDFTATIRRAT